MATNALIFSIIEVGWGIGSQSRYWSGTGYREDWLLCHLSWVCHNPLGQLIGCEF